MANGEYGACTYTDECALTGTQTRTNSVCVDGVAQNRDETMVMDACNRQTENVVVDEGQFGECVFGGTCEGIGTKTRTQVVCVAGVPTDRDDTSRDGCDRPTDGSIAQEGQWSVCDGFDTACDETGTRTRTNGVCRNGNVVNEERPASVPATPRALWLSKANLANAVAFLGPVMPQALKSVLIASVVGALVVEEVDQVCRRDVEGTVVNAPEFGACGGYDTDCDETGTQSRTVTVCRGGFG